MELMHRYLLALFVGSWFLMGADCKRGSTCGCGADLPPPPPASSCLDTATSVVTASPGTRVYSFAHAGRGVDARGVEWLLPFGSGENGLEIRDAGPGCWSGGKVSGPYLPGVAVYECDAEHCPDGDCPSPCMPYHTTAAMQWEDDGPSMVVEDFCIEHYGDGISPRDDVNGPLTVRRVHAHELLDDAIEDDWCDSSVTVEDSYFEEVAQGFASRLRGSASGDCTDQHWTIRSSLVHIKRPLFWYREGDKPGDTDPKLPGVWKLNNGTTNQPTFNVTDNWFVVEWGGGEVLPPVDHVGECRNNKVLWAGTPERNQVALDDGEDGDGLTNRQRLDALAHCFTSFERGDGEPLSSFFVRTGYAAAVQQWKTDHPQSLCE